MVAKRSVDVARFGRFMSIFCWGWRIAIHDLFKLGALKMMMFSSYVMSEPRKIWRLKCWFQPICDVSPENCLR